MTTTLPTDIDFELRPAAGRIGAVVEGLDAGRLDAVLATPAAADRLRAALAEHLVLVFGRLAPSREQHVALAEVFGTPEPPQDFIPTHPEHPQICVMDSDGGYKADRWHADVVFRDVVPRGAVLCMRECPPVGGDTIWANTQAAYDELSAGMQGLLEGRRAHHEIHFDHSAEHPVVIRHPETGRKSLFVNELFTRKISNLPPEESNAVLPFLVRHVTRPDFCYRHQWQDGDVVVWDNFATQHYAVFDFDARRVVERVQIEGGAPEA